MDTHDLGNDIKIEADEFLQRKYFHVRKYYNGYRTRYGVALVKPEFQELLKMTRKTRFFQPERTTWRLSEQADVVFGKNSVTLSKRGKYLYIPRVVYSNLVTSLPQFEDYMHQETEDIHQQHQQHQLYQPLQSEGNSKAPSYSPVKLEPTNTRHTACTQCSREMTKMAGCEDLVCQECDCKWS